MNLDFNRICQLAGVSKRSGSQILKENTSYVNEEESLEDEMVDESIEAEESEDLEEESLEDEMVEVDIHELMSEIRRAKNIMAENKRRITTKQARKRKLQESKLKRTIAREVQSILAEMEEHDASWVYGEKKPRHSRKGYTNHGRTIPGIGFRK
jgi:hypothetical protein